MTVHYKTPADLPEKIRRELSAQAQELYVAIYRKTWEKCHMGDEGSDRDLAETAHDAAMLAVESKFGKQAGTRFDTDKPGDDRHDHDNKQHPKQEPDP